MHESADYTQGPQIPGLKLAEWQEPVDFFLSLWKRIIENQKLMEAEFFTMTTEFGPPPYMWTKTEDNTPIKSQWEINLFMKELLRKKMN